MNVIQRPGTQEFSATMPDYIIDTDSTISFSVLYNGKKILDEEYSPDANFQVRIRQLGKYCALALWGEWCSTTYKRQENVAGTFTFLINGVTNATTYIMFSRLKTKKTAINPGWLTEVQEKVTREGLYEYASSLFTSGEIAIVTARTESGATDSKTLYTHSGSTGIVTLDVSLAKIRSLFSSIGKIQTYQVIKGSHSFKFKVDQNEYTEVHQFRCKNVYDVPETVSTVGPITIKGNNESDLASLYGMKRKFAVTVTDEYTANSGTIFLQSDYKLWHNFLNAQENSFRQEDRWLEINITKQNYEREHSKAALKEVEFNFQMADPEENNLIEV